MFNYLIILSLIANSLSLPTNNNCCIEHHKRKNIDLTVANYDCSQLTGFGEDRCKDVLGGSVCKWGVCPQISKCSRVSKYELHFGKIVDVGNCVGICDKKTSDDLISHIDSKKQLSCSPLEFDYIDVKKKTTRAIKSCACQECGVRPNYGIIKVPNGKCVGDCEEKNKSCMSGIRDNYSLSNGQELSSPSVSLLNSAAGICPLGVQNGFDTFIDNRCFVHTIDDCIVKSNCDIRTIYLDICLQAAQVSLTNTDSLRLGTNGNGLWGVGLPILNGGSWNPGDNVCLTFDLDNLNGGVSILNNVIMDNHLDVLVQDDTAVDYLKLNINYQNCRDCLPVEQTVHSFYTTLGLQEFRNIKDCDCLDVTKCHREKLYETYHFGTSFEVSLDVGQCVGKCETGNMCNKEISLQNIKGPYGIKPIEIIEGCYC